VEIELGVDIQRYSCSGTLEKHWGFLGGKIFKTQRNNHITTVRSNNIRQGSPLSAAYIAEFGEFAVFLEF